jgi:hypothetical protein
MVMWMEGGRFVMGIYRWCDIFHGRFIIPDVPRIEDGGDSWFKVSGRHLLSFSKVYFRVICRSLRLCWP